MNRYRFALAALALLASAQASQASVIEGTVRSAADGQPITGARVNLVYSFMGFSNVVASVDSDAAGHYSFERPAGFGTGTSVVAEATSHAPLQHAGLRCAAPTRCDPASVSLSVPFGATVRVNFDLPAAAHIQGRVTDAVSGDGLSDVQVELHNPGAPFLFRYVRPQSDGSFRFDNLHAGNHVLAAYPGEQASAGPLHVPQFWPNLHCDNLQQNCTDLTPTPITLTGGASGGNFELPLQRGSVVRVRMLSLGNGDSIQQTTTLRAVSGSSGLNATSSADGYAYVGPLLPGPVRILLQPTATGAYPAIVHPDLPCSADPCDLSGAPTITVPAATLVTASDVYVSPLRTVRGRVSDGTGQGLAGVRVSAGDIMTPTFGAWGFFSVADAITGEKGEFQLEGLDRDTFIVRTRHRAQGWTDSAWPNSPCNGQNLFCEREDSNYSRVDLAQNANPTGIDLVIGNGTHLQGRVVDEVTGAANAHWYVAVIPASANLVSKSVQADAQGNFRIDGLTSEAYFLWASALPAFSNNSGAVYPNLPCRIINTTVPPDCDLTAATALTPASGGIDGLVIRVPPPDALFSDSFEGPN